MDLLHDIKKLMNEHSIDMINEEEDNSKNEIRIVYLEKDYIPGIQILDKNRLICGGIEYQINEYYNKSKEKIKKIKDINDNSVDLLDDNKYDICELCEYSASQIFFYKMKRKQKRNDRVTLLLNCMKWLIIAK